MLPTRVYNEFNGRADLPGAGLVPLGLVERDKGVGIPVVNQGGRNPGVQVENGRERLADIHPVGQPVGLRTKGLHEALWRAAIVEVLG